MTPRRRGLTLLGVQLVLALGVIGRLAFDRATLPRVWVRTVAVDPEDPLRGRYVRLWLDADDRRTPGDSTAAVEFAVLEGRLAVRRAEGWRGFRTREPAPPSALGVVVDEPLAYFIPERGPDPSRLPAGMDLWAEVTVPPHGLPRPIRVEARPSAP